MKEVPEGYGAEEMFELRDDVQEVLDGHKFLIIFFVLKTLLEDLRKDNPSLYNQLSMGLASAMEGDA